MSEEDVESSSEHDFSDNSEDDWNPAGESSDDDSDPGTQSTSSPSSPKKRRGGGSAKRPAASRRRPAVKKDEKPKATRTGKVMSDSIKELLERAKASRKEKLDLSAGAGSSQNGGSPKKVTNGVNGAKKGAKPASDDDESSSSGDEYLVDPSQLDFGSTFFKSVSPAPKETRIPTPDFDCQIGMGKLSDDDEDDEDEKDIESKEQNPTLNVMANLNNFVQNLEEARDNLKKYEEKKETSEISAPANEVSNLLALGEAKEKTKEAVPAKKRPAAKKRRKSEEESGGSDWEEVEDHNPPPANDSYTPENVEVTLGLGDGRRTKLQNDLEVAIKRQLNKEKREQQILLHQAGFTEWLDQGNYINGVLNNTSLFQVALKLLGGQSRYPKGKADMKYIEEISIWYKKTMTIPPAAGMYPPLSDDLDMVSSLRRQIESKQANSKRDFVLIFIIILRAIGIQCRMVINLVVPPIRPPSSELCRITTNPPKAESSSKQKSTSKGKPKSKKALSESDDDYDEIVTKLSSKTRAPREKSISKPTDESTTTSKAKRGSSSKTSSTKVKEEKPEAERPSTSKATRKSTKPDKETLKQLKPEQTMSPRKTRSRTPSKMKIPQMDGMDEIASPIGKRTRSRSKTPVPKVVKKTLLTKDAADSPIRSKRVSKNSLQVPEMKKSPKKVQSASSAEETELFAVDPAEKKTVIKPKKAATKRPATTTEEEPGVSTKKQPRFEKVKAIDRRVLSTDDDEDKKSATNKVDFWPEIWAEQEEKWVCVNLFKDKKVEVDCCDRIVRNATTPVAYILAWNNNSSIKDITLRYCPQWHTVNKKMRTDEAFVEAALKPFVGQETERDKKEDEFLKQMIMDRPMPTSISEFKNHPLYVLKRHLLKFEAIYPPEPPTLGFVRGEPVYARECVHTLHSRELWVKQARVVKPGETPYKIVKARPKWERATNTVIKDQPLEIFGHWQTKEYEPPVAKDGIVPKNEYGNVELFKACMLPINTVHLPYPGLNKVCKRLKIDYAPAMTGFDFHGGFCHPVFEGFVVCKEFAELVTDAWIKDTEEAEKREAEKFQERVYGNWKRLIKGLLIKKRLQLRYNFEENDAVSTQG